MEIDSNGIDQEALQRAFDCIGTGDESLSPIPRLHRFLSIDPESGLDAVLADRKIDALFQRQT